MAKENILGRHEVLHMSSYFMLNIDKYLLEHPEVKKMPEWENLAHTAHQALFDLYQSVGAATLDNV